VPTGPATRSSARRRCGGRGLAAASRGEKPLLSDTTLLTKRRLGRGVLSKTPAGPRQPVAVGDAAVTVRVPGRPGAHHLGDQHAGACVCGYLAAATHPAGRRQLAAGSGAHHADVAQEIVRRRRRHDGADGRRAEHRRAGRDRGAACPGEGRRQGAETGTPRLRSRASRKEVRTGGWLSAPPDEVAHLGPGRDAQLAQDVRDVNRGGLR
jgi:hypothetical protein